MIKCTKGKGRGKMEERKKRKKIRWRKGRRGR
jgi:hypothetical protein